MGKQKSGLPAIVPVLISEMKIGKDDLIAVAVSRDETRLLTEQAELDSQIRGRRKDIKEAQRGLDKSREASVQAKAKDLAPVKKALEALGFTDVQADVHVGNATGKTIEYSIVVKVGNGYNRFERCASTKKTADQRKLEKEITAHGEQVDHLQRLSIEIRKRLSQLSSLERRAKAKFAESILNRTDEGKAFLASIDGIKSLPMPTDIG